METSSICHFFVARVPWPQTTELVVIDPNATDIATQEAIMREPSVLVACSGTVSTEDYASKVRHAELATSGTRKFGTGSKLRRKKRQAAKVSRKRNRR